LTVGTRPPPSRPPRLDPPCRRRRAGYRKDSTTDNGNTDEDRDDLAQVHYLPATQSGEVIDAELVTDEEYARLTSQKARMLERAQGYRRDVVATSRVVKTVASHTGTKTVLRNALYVPAGRSLWENGCGKTTRTPSTGVRCAQRNSPATSSGSTTGNSVPRRRRIAATSVRWTG
jgi:hypothetical protein